MDAYSSTDSDDSLPEPPTQVYRRTAPASPPKPMKNLSRRLNLQAVHAKAREPPAGSNAISVHAKARGATAGSNIISATPSAASGSCGTTRNGNRNGQHGLDAHVDAQQGGAHLAQNGAAQTLSVQPASGVCRSGERHNLTGKRRRLHVLPALTPTPTHAGPRARGVRGDGGGNAHARREAVEFPVQQPAGGTVAVVVAEEEHGTDSRRAACASPGKHAAIGDAAPTSTSQLSANGASGRLQPPAHGLQGQNNHGSTESGRVRRPAGYRGIVWCSVGHWQVQIYDKLEKVQSYVGTHKDERSAVELYNTAAREKGLLDLVHTWNGYSNRANAPYVQAPSPRKAMALEKPPAAAEKPRTPRYSQYKGVNWNLRASRWTVTAYNKETQKQEYVGVSRDEKAAVEQYNIFAAKKGLVPQPWQGCSARDKPHRPLAPSSQRANASNKSSKPADKPKPQTPRYRYSQYKGVSWDRRASRWVVSFYNKETQRQEYVGRSRDEKAAVEQYNIFAAKKAAKGQTWKGQSNSPAASAQASPTKHDHTRPRWRLWDSVEARYSWDENSAWHKGMIVKVQKEPNGSLTYGIKYDDGQEDADVWPDSVRHCRGHNAETGSSTDEQSDTDSDGDGVGQVPITAEPLATSSGMWEQQSCAVCTRTDDDEHMLLCDGCNDGFHTFCLSPPLDSIPDGSWQCASCSATAICDSTNDLAAPESPTDIVVLTFSAADELCDEDAQSNDGEQREQDVTNISPFRFSTSAHTTQRKHARGNSATHTQVATAEDRPVIRNTKRGRFTEQANKIHSRYVDLIKFLLSAHESTPSLDGVIAQLETYSKDRVTHALPADFPNRAQIQAAIDSSKEMSPQGDETLAASTKWPGMKLRKVDNLGELWRNLKLGHP